MMKIKINENFGRISPNYLFSDIAKKVKAFSAAHPELKIIRLGIGDVTLPLSPCVTQAMTSAVAEMGKKETFRGYAPEYGYDFLREAVSKHYARFHVAIAADDIFVSDGAKSDLGNLVDIFGDNEILIPDPVYPVYMDSNLMSGRKIRFLSARAENGFLPLPNDSLAGEGYIIYLCSPNNPTGAVYSREGLAAWIDFAQRTGSLIIYDSAYEAYIHGNAPHTVYEVPGAEKCAVEVCSLSKTAGFTGTRCAWTVIPPDITVNGVALASLWARRQATKYNGLPYVIQRGAEAALSDEGRKQCMESVSYYMENATIIAKLLTDKKIWFTGGQSSPYLWLKCPDGMSSWDFFDYLLEKVQVVGTPGEGFGKEGAGYFRLTAFGSREDTIEAVHRLERVL